MIKKTKGDLAGIQQYVLRKAILISKKNAQASKKRRKWDQFSHLRDGIQMGEAKGGFTDNLVVGYKEM